MIKDHTGIKFNKLTAIKFTRILNRRTMWLFQCDCGNSKELGINNVNRSNNPIKSCGCDSSIQYRGLRALQNVCYTDCRYDDGDLTLDQFIELSQKPCTYCGKQAKDSNYRKTRSNIKGKNIKNVYHFYYNGLDRVDNNKPHNYDNCVPCCARCNSWKQNLPLKEFKEIINKIHQKINA